MDINILLFDDFEMDEKINKNADIIKRGKL